MKELRRDDSNDRVLPYEGWKFHIKTFECLSRKAFKIEDVVGITSYGLEEEGGPRGPHSEAVGGIPI